ncbi:MAG: hypothetical protein H8D23_28205 [Candidatus Brocadiales bacterium]|nr:hypothetical protein [Candidatus Brocadiales bacterium]
MKISDTNQQINKKPELSRVDSADNPASIKKTEQKTKNTVPAAVMSDTVELSRESLALANSVKAESGDKVAPVQKNVNENALVELLKMANKQRGIFDSSEGISRTKAQENTDNDSGRKIDFLL